MRANFDGDHDGDLFGVEICPHRPDIYDFRSGDRGLPYGGCTTPHLKCTEAPGRSNPPFLGKWQSISTRPMKPQPGRENSFTSNSHIVSDKSPFTALTGVLDHFRRFYNSRYPETPQSTFCFWCYRFQFLCSFQKPKIVYNGFCCHARCSREERMAVGVVQFQYICRSRAEAGRRWFT